MPSSSKAAVPNAWAMDQYRSVVYLAQGCKKREKEKLTSLNFIYCLKLNYVLF